MEKRAGTCWAMACESTTLALLVSQYPYGKNRGLHVIAAEWFLMGPADFSFSEIQIIFLQLGHSCLFSLNCYLYSLIYYILSVPTKSDVSSI